MRLLVSTQTVLNGFNMSKTSAKDSGGSIWRVLLFYGIAALQPRGLPGIVCGNGKRVDGVPQGGGQWKARRECTA